MRRHEKIKLLKDLAQGKISITEAFPPPVVIWFLEGDYYQNASGERLNKKEFAKRKHEGLQIILRPAEGCEPLKD